MGAEKRLEENLEQAASKVANRNDERAQREEILLLTNQRLLQCAFDPACEKEILDGVDRCKETVASRLSLVLYS